MNYTGFVDTALKQITDKGRTITVRSPGVGEVYNPATDTFTAADPVDVNTKAVFTKFSQKDIDGEIIKRTDQRVLIAAASLATAPDTEDKILDGLAQYSVIHTEIVKPGDTEILYMVQVRK